MHFEATLSVLRHSGILFESLTIEKGVYTSFSNFEEDHKFYYHTPLWNYENPIYSRPYSNPNTKPLFTQLDSQTFIHNALEHTSLIVFLGAAATPSLRRALQEPETLILIFDISPERIARMAEEVGTEKLFERVKIFLGSVNSFRPPLGMSLPENLFTKGFPVFFTLPGEHGLPESEINSCVQLLEILFYRHILYPLSGQFNNRGLPLRPMTRGLFYDQQLHFYQNISDYLRSPDIGVLRRAFHNETAILIAAGPDLPSRFEYLREQRSKAVLICVNTALKPLLQAGIKPHFVIINDTSIAAGQSFSGLPHLDDVCLVGHALSNLGEDIFHKKFIFGTYWPELFGVRPSLRLHGSVITAAYSLAHHMGCSRCVLVGVQLCSENPWAMIYSKGSIHENITAQGRPLTNSFPQLVPVLNGQGETVYTTLNFLDAAIWFLEENRTTDMDCINTCTKSIVHGAGVTIKPNFYIPDTPYLHRRFRQIFRKVAKPIPKDVVRSVLSGQMDIWKKNRDRCSGYTKMSGSKLINKGFNALSYFDQNNVSYLVQRFSDFENKKFHKLAFSNNPLDKEKGLVYIFEYISKMSDYFSRVISAQVKKI